MIRAFLVGMAMGACGVLLAGLLLLSGPSASDSAIDKQRASAERTRVERELAVDQGVKRVAGDAERLAGEVSEARRRIRELEGASQIAVGSSERVVVLVGKLGIGIEKAVRLSELLDSGLRKLQGGSGQENGD